MWLCGQPCEQDQQVVEEACCPVVRFTKPLGTVAEFVVNVIHNGAKFPVDMLSEMKTALVECGPAFRFHALWLHVSGCAPHEPLLRRLALCVGVPVNCVAISGGYNSIAEFHRELDGWMAWYAVTRRRNDIRQRNAMIRACELFGTLHTSSPDQSCVADDAVMVAGVSVVAGICDADRDVRVDVVSQGLLCNQKLGSCPKGVLVTWLFGVQVLHQHSRYSMLLVQVHQTTKPSTSF